MSSRRDGRATRSSERRRSRSPELSRNGDESTRDTPIRRRRRSPSPSAIKKNTSVINFKKEKEREQHTTEARRSNNHDNDDSGDNTQLLRAAEVDTPNDDDDVATQKPNFGLTGKLAAETSSHNGVALKYNEPTEARKPAARWRLYVFKKDEHIDMLHIHRQSAYLLGKDRRVADIPIDHPSCSKQHAVLQFRLMAEQTPVSQLNVEPKRVVKPFIIDLDSTNGTFVNDERIPPSRYYELRPKDTIRFGCSTREYVLIREDDVRSELAKKQDNRSTSAEATTPPSHNTTA